VCESHTLIVVTVTTLFLSGLRNRALTLRNFHGKCASPKATVLSPFATFDKACIGPNVLQKEAGLRTKGVTKNFLEAGFWEPPVCKS